MLDCRLSESVSSSKTIPHIERSARLIGTGVAYYFLTTAVVMIGAYFGYCFVEFCSEHPSAKKSDFASALAAWDGRWYMEIVDRGYSYRRDNKANVAFFPVYPLLACGVSRLTGLRAEIALLLVSHISLIGAFVMASVYLKERFADNPNARGCALLTMGVLPSTLYFRMTYTESLFILFVILLLYGMQREWPNWTLAIVVGAATGTRPVGVVLIVPLFVHIVLTSKSRWQLIREAVMVIPASAWGIGGFMCYQWWAFNEPFAFAKVQAFWATPGVGPENLIEKLVGLGSFEPLRMVYDDTCPCYWAAVPPANNMVFNLSFANPIAFGLVSFVIVVGAYTGVLSTREWILSVALLAFPYIMHSDRTCMMAEMRYTSVVFPVYVIAGQALARLPPGVVGALAGISASFLFAYSSLFVCWYWYY